MQTLLLAIVLPFTLMVLSCCNEQTPTPTKQPDQDVITYAGPPISLDISPHGEKTRYHWSFEVPTGGWRAKFVRARTSGKPGGWMEIDVDLIGPADDEMVTQAFEHITGEYIYKTGFNKVRVFVQQFARGDEPEPERYELAVVRQD